MLDMITNPLLKELLKTITFKFNNCIQQKTPFIYKNHLIMTIYDVTEWKRWVAKNEIIYRIVKCSTEIGEVTFVIKLVNKQIIKTAYMNKDLTIFLNNHYNFINK